MDAYRRSGIVTGRLFIAATVAGCPSLNAVPVLDAPGCLMRIAANEPRVLTGALLVFIIGCAGGGIGISMYPVLRTYNEGLAVGAAGFRIVEGVFDCIGPVLLLMLATLSRQFVAAGPTALAQLQNLGAPLVETRTSTRDVAALPAWCPGACLYHSLFYPTRLVPRWFSVWGLAGIALTVASSILVLFRQIAPFSASKLPLNLPIARGFDPSAEAVPRH